MELEFTRGGVSFDTAVEEWMEDLQFTEVMNLALEPVTEDEMQITRVLDGLLYEVIFGDRLADPIQRLAGQPSKLIRGRRTRKGEQGLQTAMGSAVDWVFKSLVERELSGGQLQAYQSRLTVTPGGTAGPDVFMTGSPMVAWDVTTRGSASDHVERDNFGRGWNRYYLLIWDEPGTGFHRGGRVQRLSRRV